MGAANANALNFSNHGCSSLPPIQINQRTLYVQARQAIVRDLERDPFRGYQGNDLTILSTHLFDGHTIVSWAFQSVPHSIVWAVRDDGVLLGLTTVAEQEVLAWHRHDTQGLVESVCVVPEGTEDALYLVVNRNGIRMTERMASRSFTDIQNAVSVDCSLPFDGRNTTSTTLTLSGGTTWAHDELLTISASAPVTWSVGNAMVLTASDGTVIRFTIQTVSTSQSATGFADLTVPSSLQNVARTTWGRAVLSVSGLDHLNGYAVSVTADGYVVANPNNPDYATITVSGGVATFPAPYIYGRVGLPFVCDLETLDIDTPSGPSLRDKKMLINKITLQVLAARGIFCGVQAPSNDSTGGLFEMKLRTAATYGAPVVPITGTVQESIENSWNSETNGRVFVRQVDPLPLTILAVVPTGFFPPAN